MSSPNSTSGGLATFNVKVAGSAVPDTVSIVSVRIDSHVNRISSATITILDGNPDTGDFPVSSSSTFVGGATIVIEAGYEAKNTVVFTGIITAQSIRIDPVSGPLLEVQCRSVAIKMTEGKSNRTFTNKKDSEIISSIFTEYEIQSEVAPTADVLQELVQNNISNWDFILMRAKANEMVISTSNDVVTIGKPDANTTSVLTVGYGQGLLEFYADRNSFRSDGGQNLSAVQGSAKFQGSSLVKVSNYITLQGLGTRFSGDFFISGVAHELEGGNWITEVDIGLAKDLFP